MTTVLVLTSMYPPHHYGGYELSCRDVVRRFRAAGHAVTVLTTNLRVDDAQTEPGEEDEGDEGVLRELDWYWADHELRRPPLRRCMAIERRNQAVLGSVLGRARPDVVSIWQMGAMSLGLLSSLARARLPLVYVVCDDWLVYGPRVDPWTRVFSGHRRVGSIVGRLSGAPAVLPDLGRTGTFCFVSDSVRRRAESSTPWRFPDSTVVYSGIDRRDFPLRPALDPTPWRWRLLYVGRIDPRKGIDTVIRALRRLPTDAELEVIGAGDRSHLQELEALVGFLGLEGRVRFGSGVRRSCLSPRYQEADAVVFPPLWDEPFGLVPLEAMSSGVPVVATATGGSAEFLRDRWNCLRFPAGDDEALAGALYELAGDPELRAGLVRAGLRTAEELDVDRLADVLEGWHVGAATGFSGGRPADRRLTAASPAPEPS